MSQTTIIRRRRQLYAYSFTTGVKPVKPPVVKTDDDKQAHLLWLERNGQHEEALRLLELYCSR